MIQKISTRSVCPVLQAGTTSRRHGAGTSGGNERDGRTKQTSLQFELSAEPLPQRNDGTAAQTLQQYLRDIMAHCTGKEEAEKTVSDFSDKKR